MTDGGDLDMAGALSQGVNNGQRAAVTDSRELIGKHTKTAPRGEAVAQDVDDPNLQSRLIMAIVDEESGDGRLTLERLAEIAGAAGLTPDTTLAMLGDGRFQDKLDEMRWQVLVTPQMGAILKAATSAAKEGDLRAISKLLDYQDKRAARRRALEQKMLESGSRSQILEMVRRVRNRLSRMVEVLEEEPDRTPLEDQAKQIFEAMHDGDRALNPDEEW